MSDNNQPFPQQSLMNGSSSGTGTSRVRFGNLKLGMRALAEMAFPHDTKLTFTRHELPQDGTAQSPAPLHILTSRPAYIPTPDPDPPLDAGEARIYINWGTLNDQLATNWDDDYVITTTKYYFAKATLPTTGPLKVTSWEIVDGASATAFATADWNAGDDRPAIAYHLLGSVIFTDGKAVVAHAGGGSLLLTEHITSIAAGPTPGTTVMSKHLHFLRLNY